MSPDCFLSAAFGISEKECFFFFPHVPSGDLLEASLKVKDVSGVQRYRTRTWWNAWRVCQYWREKERQHRSCKGVSPDNFGILREGGQSRQDDQKKARRRNMIIAGELNEGRGAGRAPHRQGSPGGAKY